MATRWMKLREAFPALAYRSCVHVDELKALLLQSLGYDVGVHVPAEVEVRFAQDAYSVVWGGTWLKPKNARANLREKADTDVGDLTILGDGGVLFEVDRGHPLRNPLVHWSDLTAGEKVASVVVGAACIGLAVLAVRTASRG